MSNFRARLASSFLGLPVGLALAFSVNAQQGATAQAGYLNPALPVERRVDDLIGRMTLEEKVSQMRDHAVPIPRLGVPKYDWWN
jgi:beta-glucosidase